MLPDLWAAAKGGASFLYEAKAGVQTDCGRVCQRDNQAKLTLAGGAKTLHGRHHAGPRQTGALAARVGDRERHERTRLPAGDQSGRDEPVLALDNARALSNKRAVVAQIGLLDFGKRFGLAFAFIVDSAAVGHEQEAAKFGDVGAARSAKTGNRGAGRPASGARM